EKPGDPEADDVDVARRWLRLLGHVDVEARVRVRSDADTGRTRRLVDDPAPGRVALEDAEDGLALVLGKRGERRQDAGQERIVEQVVDQAARGREDRLQAGEPGRGGVSAHRRD